MGRRAPDVSRWRNRTQADDVTVALFLLLVGVLLDLDGFLAAALHIAVLLFPELVRIVVQDLVGFLETLFRLDMISKQ